MWDVTTVAATGSTNADLAAEARAGAPAGRVLVADHQSAGRGRLDRRWEDEPGSSLLVSLLLRPDLAPGQLHVVTQAVGVAACRAVARTAGVTAGLKWPNDVVVPVAGDDGGTAAAKLGGILAELVAGGPPDAGPPAVVVGLGLNLRWSSGRLAAVAAAPGGQLPVDLASLTPDVPTRDALLAALLGELDELEHPGQVAAAYRGLLVTLGRTVRVELPGGHLSGRAVDVTAAGELVVEDDAGARRAVSVGDVVHLR